jgi:hypothetical protein
MKMMTLTDEGTLEDLDLGDQEDPVETTPQLMYRWYSEEKSNPWAHYPSNSMGIELSLMTS